MSKTNVTLSSAVLEFTPAKRFRESLAEGAASGMMRLSGLTVVDGRRVTLSVQFAAPTDGVNILSPVYEDGEAVIKKIHLRNPEGELQCVRVGADGAPEETLTGPDGEPVPSSSVCCWVAFGVGTAALEVDNVSEPVVRKSGVYVDADLAGQIKFTPPIDPFGGRVAGIRSVPVFGPTPKMVEAAERRRASRAAEAAEAPSAESAVVF